MKWIRFILAVGVFSMAFSVWSQDLSQTFTTSGGLIVRYPSDFTTTEMGTYSVNLYPSQFLYTLNIYAGQDVMLNFFGNTEPERVSQTYNDIAPFVGSTENIENTGTFTINGIELVQVSVDLEDGSSYTIIAGKTMDGIPLAALLITTDAIAEDFALARDILANVTFAPTADMSLLQLTAQIVMDDGRINPDTLPDGTGLFWRGSSFVYDGVEYSTIDSDPIENALTLTSNDFAVAIAVSDEENTIEDPLTYLEGLALVFGRNLTQSEAQDAIQTIVLDDGRTAYLVTLYNESNNPEATAIPDQTPDSGFVIGLVPLAQDRYGWAYATVTKPTPLTQVTEDVLIILNSFVLDPNYVQPTEAPFVQEDFTMATASNGNVMEVIQATCTSFGFETANISLPIALVQCPANCTDGVIYGTDLYTDDSAVCTAAIHAGVLPIEGGIVEVQYEEGQTSYTASTQNNITSFAYGEWVGSIRVLAVEGE